MSIKLIPEDVDFEFMPIRGTRVYKATDTIDIKTLNEWDEIYWDYPQWEAREGNRSKSFGSYMKELIILGQQLIELRRSVIKTVGDN